MTKSPQCEQQDALRSSAHRSVHRNSSSAEFFDGAVRGELLIKSCRACGHFRAARRDLCRSCGTSEFDWADASGEATLISWAFHPPTEDGPGSLFGLVEITEGPWLESILIGIDQLALRPGMPLRVTFIAGEEGEPYPAFQSA